MGCVFQSFISPFVTLFAHPFDNSTVYSCVWFVAVLGVSDVTNTVDENGAVNQDSIPWYYFTLLLLGYFW